MKAKVTITMPLPSTTTIGVGSDGGGQVVVESESDALTPEEYREFVATALAAATKGMNGQEQA